MDYQTFCETMHDELAPETLLEETLAAEIAGASWRLRQYSGAESEPAVERSRAAAHCVLNRSINQLRRLQTDRACREALNLACEYPGLVDHKQVAAALNRSNNAAKPQQGRSQGLSLAEIEALCAPLPCAFQPPAPIDLGSFCKPETSPEPEAASTPSPQLASFCKTAPAPRQTPRNAPCPCGSRQKYKRCCGRNAPPVLGHAA